MEIDEWQVRFITAFVYAESESNFYIQVPRLICLVDDFEILRFKNETHDRNSSNPYKINRLRITSAYAI